MSHPVQTIEKVISPYQFCHRVSMENLPVREADYLRSTALRTQVQKGETLFRQDSHARGVYVLERGKVKIYQEKKAGARRMLHIYSQGDILGYRPLFSDCIHSFSAEALEPCSMIFIPKDSFSALIDSSPYFAQFLLKAVSQEFSAWSNFQSAFDSRPVRARIALALLILHEKFRLPGNATAVIQLSRTDLAEYVVASLETVVRTLRELKDMGLVHIRGRRMLLNDVDALIALAIPPVGLTSPAARA